MVWYGERNKRGNTIKHSARETTESLHLEHSASARASTLINENSDTIHVALRLPRISLDEIQRSNCGIWKNEFPGRKTLFRSLKIHAVTVSLIAFFANSANSAKAHDDHTHRFVTHQDLSQPPGSQKPGSQKPTNESEAVSARVISPAEAFQPFANTVQIRSNGRSLFIESNGLPQHSMMIGIRSWQQQVPLPQPYSGSNAWQIPLQPRLAARPISAKTNLFRGAIAIAVNGVPIFNALNNRKEDAFLAGELDKWGGHCGRGDDYHYHTAPVHLEKIVGKGNPIAYALDGFPIYGETEADGTPVGKLDEFNGQFDKSGNYHYHATKTYPYINGGMRGEVTVRGGQVDPQPRDSPLRPPGEPLRGAAITNFTRQDGRYLLEYKLAGRQESIAYAVTNGNIDFEYKNANGRVSTESYRWSLDRGVSLPTGDEERNAEYTNENASGRPSAEIGRFTPGDSNMLTSLTVSSFAVESNGEIQSDFTCDGSGESPPVSWSPGPDGTTCYALNFWHVPGQGDLKSYWVLYDIPSDVTSIPQNSGGGGRLGLNDKDRSEYDPICSRGPGTKEYHITVYALSEQPAWSSGAITRSELLNEIADITLAEGTLTFQYTRSGTSRWKMVIASVGLLSIVAYLAFVRRRSS